MLVRHGSCDPDERGALPQPRHFHFRQVDVVHPDLALALALCDGLDVTGGNQIVCVVRRVHDGSDVGVGSENGSVDVCRRRVQRDVDQNRRRDEMRTSDGNGSENGNDGRNEVGNENENANEI